MQILIFVIRSINSQSLLLQGAYTTIKNNKCKTPLDECCDTNKDEIVSLFSKYNPKPGKVLSNNSIVLLLVWYVII